MLPKTVKKQLEAIRRLREKGEFLTALKQLKAISVTSLSIEDQFSFKFLEGRLALDLGELRQVRELIGELNEFPMLEENILQAVDVLLLEIEIGWRSADLESASMRIQAGFDKLKEIITGSEAEAKRREGALFHHQGIVYWYKGELDEALDSHQQSLTIKTELNDRAGIARSYNNLGLVYWSRNDLNQAIEFYHRALEVSEELVDKRISSVTLSNLGNCYTRIGDLEKALEYQLRSLAIKEEIGSKHDISMSLLNTGVVYQLKGNLNQAHEYYQRSLDISEEVGLPADVALAINNLGNIYELKGDLDQALDHFKRSLTLYEELGIREQTALLFSNIGNIYRKKGDYQQAQQYYQRSLMMFTEFGNTSLMASILAELVWVALERKDTDLVQHSLSQLKEIDAQMDNRIIHQRFRVAQALVLKASNRTRQKLKATEILEQVVKEEIGDHSLTVKAMINLCDLLLTELKLTGEAELITEIHGLTSQLLEIAKQQSSHSLLAETYLLQSKLALVQLDMGQASKLLTQAQAIADESGLERLSETLTQERTLLDSQIQKWDLIVKDNPSTKDLIELTQLDNVLERMIQETVTDMMGEQGITSLQPPKKYQITYLDFLKTKEEYVKTTFRVGIAQIGLSESGDILHEYYQEEAPGLFKIRKEKIAAVQSTLTRMVGKAADQDVKILAFPELSIDLNYKAIFKEVLRLAKKYDMYIIPGSYHQIKNKHNISPVISPDGILWEQAKHIPATIHFQNQRINEGITVSPSAGEIVVANTKYGRIAIIICRDFLDMDLRVELKNFEPPIDIIINPAFTPVTADFKAIHFDARRSIYAYSFFVNIAEFGDSLIYTPERERAERTIVKGKEAIIHKDIDLFKLRAARSKWEMEQQKTKSFIQSTR
jgi:tetratricopeptide (TPR) repeat protein/predicted amidohydrolase